MAPPPATATDDIVETPGGGQLRPFRKGDGRAAAAGRKGVAARQANRAAKRADALAIVEGLRTLAGTVNRDDLGPIAVAAALDMIGRVQRGEQAVKDPAEWVKVLVDVARLESGEATSASIVAHIGPAEVKTLRDEARKALASPDPVPTALAAAEDDTP